jgi:hypothetical protein
MSLRMVEYGYMEFVIPLPLFYIFERFHNTNVQKYRKVPFLPPLYKKSSLLLRFGSVNTNSIIC